MLPRRKALPVVAMIALAFTLACSDSRVLGPPGGEEGPTAPSASVSGSPQTAKMFITDSFADKLVRYGVTSSSGAVLEVVFDNINDAGGIAFDAAGELFLPNRTGGTGGGSIERYLDPEGTLVFNGNITSASGAPFATPHWVAFGTDELYVAQGAGPILRFLFDGAGAASYNGSIPVSGTPRGVAVNPATGEVFLSENTGSTIQRFLIDGSGNAIPNGVITAGLSGPHGMAFSPWGELFVANTHASHVSRFTFDASGNAVPNGQISGSGMGAPIGLDFSPWGELFVTNHFQTPGLVTRWTFDTFDASGTATFNGSFSVPTTGYLTDVQFLAGDGGPPPNAPPAVAADLDAVTVDEGQTASNSGVVGDEDGDAVTLTASVGSIAADGFGAWSWSLDTADGPAESQTVTIDASDGNGGVAQTSFELTVTNVAPMVTAVSVPGAPVDIGDQPTSASATFSDPAGTADEAYACNVDYGDGSGPQPGTVSGTTCTGPDHTYGTPGVYQTSVTVTDKDGGSASLAAETYTVIYDPTGGFVTGGGWIDSPPGAYAADPMLGGKASFGFVSKYKKGATAPTGNTEFHFKAGAFDFRSSAYDWLVVNAGGTRAQFKGWGSVNGMEGYRFMLWAQDDGPDTFRIRIWTEDAAGVQTDVYDNGTDQSIGGGSIVVHDR